MSDDIRREDVLEALDAHFIAGYTTLTRPTIRATVTALAPSPRAAAEERLRLLESALACGCLAFCEPCPECEAVREAVDRE